MLTSIHHGPVKRETGEAIRGGKSAPKIVQPGSCNPLWQQLATRVQTKLDVSEPGDVYEQEADRVAEHVMSTTGPAYVASFVSSCPSRPRSCSCGGSCDKCRNEEHGGSIQHVQMKPTTGAGPALTLRQATASAIVEAVLESPGQPLDSVTRKFMETRFQHDFSTVRIHTGENATATARSIHAQAYTMGNSIVFGAGRFRPDTTDGRRLIAHELTHTIQQSGRQKAEAVQRSPDPPLKSQPVLAVPRASFDPLFFSAGFHPGPIDLTKPGDLQGERFVSQSNIVEWAAQQIFSDVTSRGGGVERDRLVKLLRRGENDVLHGLWRSHANSVLMLVAPSGFVGIPTTGPAKGTTPSEIRSSDDNPFTGSESARAAWANYLFTNWSRVDERLDEKTTDLYVEKIRSALHTRLIPAGATLVKQPQQVKQIEDAPENVEVPLGRWGATARKDFEWMGKRMKSTSTYSVVFEIVGHEGVYFDMGVGAFVKTDPFVGKVASDVVKNTRGIVVVGQFIKGFLNALASPVLIVLDTSAKVLDMATMAVSTVGKWRGWYDVGYTCLSSTCRGYEACLGTKSTEDCKSEVLKTAVEEATIVIPIYRQGSDCLGGDAEACGAIAALALGLVEGGVRKLSKGKVGATKGGTPLSPGELEDVAIRGAIESPRPNDPQFAEAFERPKPAQETTTSAPRLEITKPTKAAPPTAGELVAERAVHDAASKAGSEIKLGDGKHGVAAAGKGERAGFHLCSGHCSLIADKLEQIEKILPDKSEMRRDVGFLKNKVRGFDKMVKEGKMSQEMADRAALDIANGLRTSAGTPIIDTLLQMSIEDMRANLPSLRKQVSRAFELGQEVAGEFKEAGRKGARTELPEGTDEAGTTTKPRTSSLTQAEMLAAELTKEVGPRPPGHEAHHIIPKGMKQAAEARTILEDARVGINEAANGIWLPKDTGVPNPFAGDIHSKVHTTRAIRIMTEQLREGAKEGPAGVRRALRQIQLTLSDLKFER